MKYRRKFQHGYFWEKFCERKGIPVDYIFTANYVRGGVCNFGDFGMWLEESFQKVERCCTL